MNNTWYVGERISTYCIYCSERLQTFITNPNGNHSRTMHIKCEKEMTLYECENGCGNMVNEPDICEECKEVEMESR